MDLPQRKKGAAPRSRSGCLECRRHHRKCDERRPICGLCQTQERTCEYGLRITWGGRPFRKSAFGRCMAAAEESAAVLDSSQKALVVQVQSANSGRQVDSRVSVPFVYGVRRPDNVDSEHVFASPVESSQPTLSPEPSQALCTTASRPYPRPSFTVVTTTTPSWLPDIPAHYKSLLDYFCHVTDFFSCDSTVQTAFCRTFVPMAVETSHVMASMLALAAVHRTNAGLDQSPAQLALLQSVVSEQLRSTIAGSLGRPTESILATILMLCLTEVVSRERNAKSWRLHLEGAASILRDDSSGWTVRSQDPTKAFISRCFVSLMALANFSPCAPTEAVSTQILLMAGDTIETPYIDEFTAYSTSLIQVFSETGSLLRERDVDNSRSHLSVDSNKRVHDLISHLRSKISSSHRGVNTNRLGSVSSTRRLDYAKINESYHHAGLIQIYQRICNLHAYAPEIQDAVHRILELLSTVEIEVGPCPGTVMLFPIFSAGCGAIKAAHRHQVQATLQAMLDRYKIANVQHCIELLVKLWCARDSAVGPQATLTWTAFVDESIDIILY